MNTATYVKPHYQVWFNGILEREYASVHTAMSRVSILRYKYPTNWVQVTRVFGNGDSDTFFDSLGGK